MSGVDLFIGGVFFAGLLACLILVILLTIMVMQAAFSKKIVLKKNDWVCTKSHTETEIVLVPVCGSLIPVEQETTVADQWTRR